MDWYMASVARMRKARERAAALRLAAAVWCLCWVDLALCGLWFAVRLNGG
jgi:hypothetical protein